MKTTILGGVLFLAPLVVLIVLAGKVFQYGLIVAEPLDALIPIDHMAGIAFVNVLAIVLIVLICWMAGHIARRNFGGKRLKSVDAFLIDMIPSYATFKSTVGSASATDNAETLLQPVLVQFDDYQQLAFEVERSETSAVLFLPGAPSAWGGSTVIVEVDRVKMLDLPTFQAVRLQRTFGRGTLAACSVPAQSQP